MKKLLSCLTLTITLIQAVVAQNTTTISGTTHNSSGKPFAGATVLLFTTDSVLKKTTVSDTIGAFELQGILYGTYYISISAVGKAPYSSDKISCNNSSIVLPAITLQDAANASLAEVVVTGRKNFIERKVDRTVVNPDVLISNAGANALEVLEKSPGVLVSVEGNISLQGKGGVMIFIDDKPTYLSAADLAGYLRAVPASTIDQIEIMTNPPAKYDAAGNAGIINIKMKKIKIKGINGSFSLSYGQGVYARTNNSFNLNYRNNKVNLYTTISYNNTRTFQDLTLRRTYLDASTPLRNFFTQQSLFKRNPSGFNAKVGADFYLNKKTVVGIMASGFNNRFNEDLGNRAELKNENGALLSVVNALAPSRRKMDNASVNINLQHQFDKKGTELSANVDYIQYNGNQNNQLNNKVYDASNVLQSNSTLVSQLPSAINIWSAKADFSMPLAGQQKFETGLKTSFVNTSNLANFFDQENGTLKPNYIFSNHFLYRENIQAGYVNYNNTIKKWSMQLGLRLEATQIEGDQLGNPIRNDSSFSRSYANLFPTVFVSYAADSLGKHNWGFSAGRRINRPNYQDMNPFTYPLDLFTLYSGNPFLQPTFTYNSELSYTYNNNVTTSLSFDYTNNDISETIEQQDGIFYSRPGNIGKQTNLSLSINGNIKITKWWNLQGYASVVYNNTNTQLYGKPLLNRGTYFVCSPINLFQLSKQWSAELAGSYQSSVYAAQFVLVPVGTVRIAFAKKVMKNLGSVKIGLNDIFYTNLPGGQIKGLGTSTANWNSVLDTRVFTLAFSYRFNKGKGAGRREIKSAEEEKGRVKVN